MERYKIGQSASFSKTVTETDIYVFAGICGDFNPVHINKVEAEKSIFGKPVAHGLLCASFISTVIGTQLPGPGTIYMEQNLRFLKPVYINDTVTATVEIEELYANGNAKLITLVHNQNAEIVISGTALVKLP